MTMRDIAFGFLAAFAACGATTQTPLAPGEERPSQQLCIAAVDNYEHNELQTVPYPLWVQHAAHDVGAAARRDHRLTECANLLTAREAECIAHAPTLGLADQCAPAERW